MKQKRVLLAYGVSLATALAVRTIQLFYVVEPETGFFRREYQTVGNWMTAFLILALLVTAAMACFSPPPQRQPGAPGRVAAVAAMATGLALVYETLWNDFVPLMPTWVLTVELIFALLGALALFWYGLTAFVELRFSPVALLLPVVHAFVRLAVAFANYTSLSNISDNLYDTAMMCAALLFFLWLAKEEAGVDPARTSFRLLPVSLLTSQLCFLCAVPPAIVTLLRGAPLRHGTTTGFAADLALGLFALFYGVMTRRPKPITETEQEPEPKSEE